MEQKQDIQTKKPSNGFGLRLSFAIILLLFAIGGCVPVILVFPKEDVGIAKIIVLSMIALFAVLGILQFIAAIKGKKSKGANTLSIVIGSVCVWMYGLGALALIGGIQGKKAIPDNVKSNTADEERSEAQESMSEEINGVGTPTSGTAYEAETIDYIRPKMSVKGKKVIMITLIVSYSLLLIAGILLAAVSPIGKIISSIGICEEINARAYAITIGVMWVALVPSIGYYFVTVSPYDLNKKKKIILAAVTTILLVATTAIFFVVINVVKIGGTAVKEYYEGSDSWFVPLSMAFASVAFIVCYALTLFRINPAKIRTNRPEECGDGLFNVIKHIFALIIYGIKKAVKGILSFKEKQPDIFILLVTFLLTWLAFFTSFVFAIICIVVLVGVAIMYFAGVMSLGSATNGNKNKQIQINDAGTNKVLTYNPNFVEDRYEEVYEDGAGNRWYSSDGGKTVYRKD